VNQTFCAWISRASEELVQRRKFQDLLTVGSRIFHQTHWMPMLQMQRSVAEVALELVHPERGKLPVLVNARACERDGTLEHDIAVFVAQDRHAYERELRLARSRAEELLISERNAQDALADVLRAQQQEAQQRAILAEQLIGIVSHDLRTPLNAVMLGANLLANADATSTQTRIVSRISSAAMRANRLVADLLDFTQARVGSGLRVQYEMLDVHALVADCSEELRLAWPGRVLDHVRHGSGEAEADSGRLAQVVSNLVNNALTYGRPDHPVTIRSSLEETSLRISVHNLGKAIATDLLPHLFEPLRRGEREVELGSRSVGLGLYIVQQIAIAHGGDVYVESTEEQGTTFEVVVPRYRFASQTE